MKDYTLDQKDLRDKFIESNLSEDQISFTKKLHMIRINLSTIQKSIRKMVMQLQRNKFYFHFC